MPAPEPEVATTAPARLSYLPWMDGMRAIAVGGVMVFHEIIVQPGLGLHRVIGGGWHGVDVFFAISGFLITALLLREAQDLGRIRFGAFYVRRARRLLPALVTLLVVTAVGALLFRQGRARVETLEHAAVALAYVANWARAVGKDLHELNHTWSLAAEEQFYFLWPALLTGLLLLARRFRHAVVVGVGLIAAAALLWPHIATLRGWTSTRIYFGLDTRSGSIGVGSLLGALAALGHLPRGRAWIVVRRLGALVGLLGLALILHDVTVVEDAASAIGIGAEQARSATYGLVGIATTLLIWEFFESAPHLGHRLLSWPPLVAMGRISYGLYLWHLVVVISVNPGDLRGWPLVAIHVAVTFAAATASWLLIERRFRAVRPARPSFSRQ